MSKHPSKKKLLRFREKDKKKDRQRNKLARQMTKELFERTL